ncbi:uncharacterized protein LOC143045195 [Mytilus galloprovincialis]|uniref:uncharacterized protein LOC143045195 n=1 Tax=Mytilus galloprovincialis TaxID=29158 RepID=UPI003F7BF17A
MDLLARFVGICMVFVIYSAVGVEGVAFGGNCAGDGTDSGDCTETVNIVCDTTCKCTADSFRKGGSECATKIVLNAACTDGQPADQCADTLAECRDQSGFKCLCQTSNFENNVGVCAAQVAALDDPCDSMDPALDQCAVADAECRVDGTAKCLCKATHYVDGAACTIRIKPNITCTAAGQCVIHATCDTTDTNTCVCDIGYTPSPTIDPTMCNGVVKVTILTYMYMAPILISMVFLLH